MNFYRWQLCCERCTCPYSLVPDVGRRLAAGHFPRHSHTHTLLAAVAVNAERSLLPFPMGDVWVSASTSDSCRRFSDSRRFRTSDVLPGWLRTSPLCCRRLLRIWVILVYLNVALLCLPVIFTRVCFLCSQCHLEFESCSWAAIHYNPPGYSIGRHVFLSGNLTVLSGRTVISLTTCHY